MATTTLSKTAAQALLAHTQQATATITVGSAVDVSSKVGPATAFVKMGRSVATALSNNVRFRIEGSSKTSGNDEWVPLVEWTSQNGTTAASASTVNDGAFNSADTSFTITSATGFAAGDQIYLRETGTPANSEWTRVSGVVSTTVSLEEGVTRGHTNGIAVTDLAESFAVLLDLAGQVRVRLVVDTASAPSGQTVDVIAWLVTADAFSS